MMSNLTKIKSFKDGHTFFRTKNGNLVLTDQTGEEFYQVNEKELIRVGSVSIHGTYFNIPLYDKNLSPLVNEFVTPCGKDEVLFLMEQGMRLTKDAESFIFSKAS